MNYSEETINNYRNLRKIAVAYWNVFAFSANYCIFYWLFNRM